MFLNQLRAKIGAMGYSEEAKTTTTGGNALRYWANVRAMLKPRRSTKAKIYNPIVKAIEEVQIATDIEVKMVKNKIDAKQGHSGLITIRYGIGIDELLTMMNVAEAYKIIVKKSSSYTFKSPTTGKEVKAAGFEKFRLAIQKDKEALTELIALATDKIVDGYRMIDEETLASLANDAYVVEEEEDSSGYEIGDPPDESMMSDEEAGEVVAATGVFDLDEVSP